MSVKVAINREALTAFCHRWGISELSLFGSALRDDFRPDSDVDIIIDFLPDRHASLFDLVTVRDELQQIFGRKVDLVTKQGIEASQNWLRRAAILDTAERIV